MTYYRLYLHKCHVFSKRFVYDLIWSSLKMLSSMNFSGKSASDVQCYLVMELS